MYKKTCKVCSVDFESKAEKTIFCSRSCYEIGRIGTRMSSETKEKMSKSAKNFSTSIAGIESYKLRANKISKSASRELTAEEIDKVNNVLRLAYVKDRRLILKHANLPGSYIKRLNKYITSISNDKIWTDIPSFIPRKLQKMTHSEFKDFISYSKELDHREMCEKYKFSNHGYTDLCIRLPFLSRNKITERHKKESKIELIIGDFIKSKYANVKREQYLSDKRNWRFDFTIDDNLVIEVFGDFWHANPNIYSIDNLHKIQISNIARDLDKKKWLDENGYKLLIVWESDIKRRLNYVKELMINFIESNRTTAQ